MKSKEKAVLPAPTTQYKGNHFESQYKIVYQSFKECPKTMLMVCVETGIMRENICRYVADMEKSELIQIIRKGYCPHTQYVAGFYSTDEALFTKSSIQQLNLFGNGI